MQFDTGIGLLAAACTTASYVPQLLKCWRTGSTDDLSWKTFATLWIGLALWIVYGVMREDVVIGIANGISLCLLSGILFFKVREMRAAPDAARTARTG